MKTIALIAHDEKKKDMVDFVRRNLEILRQFKLVATGNTGELVEKFGLHVQRMQRGPYGGDAQIAALLVTEDLDGLIFLRDPLTSHGHGPDIFMLLRLADVHNIPTATNVASADLLLKGLFLSSNYRSINKGHNADLSPQELARALLYS